MKYVKNSNYLFIQLFVRKRDPNFELEYIEQVPKKLYRFRSFNEMI